MFSAQYLVVCVLSSCFLWLVFSRRCCLKVTKGAILLLLLVGDASNLRRRLLLSPISRELRASTHSAGAAGQERARVSNAALWDLLSLDLLNLSGPITSDCAVIVMPVIVISCDFCCDACDWVCDATRTAGDPGAAGKGEHQVRPIRGYLEPSDGRGVPPKSVGDTEPGR